MKGWIEIETDFSSIGKSLYIQRRSLYRTTGISALREGEGKNDVSILYYGQWQYVEGIGYDKLKELIKKEAMMG